MPNVNYLKNKFLSGEISPQLLGRSDLPSYASGVQTLENWVVQKTGGITRRPGTRYVAAIKTPASSARLIPFVYSLTDAYILEFSNNNIRVYKDGASLGIDITTTYTTAQIAELSYVQDGDTLYLAHSDHAPAQLTRTSDVAWSLTTITWDTTAYAERGETPTTVLTLSNKTVGTGRTATASAAAFIDADVGRDITMSDGALATITAYTSTTVVTVQIKTAFASVTCASGTWTIEGSPQSTITPSIKEPIGATVTLSASINTWKNNASYSHIGKWVSVNGGLVEITTVSGGATHTTSENVALTSGNTVPLSHQNISAVAIGAYVEGTDYLVNTISGLINSITLDGTFTVTYEYVTYGTSGIIRKRIPDLTPAVANTWSVNSSVWTATDGYPRAVTVFEQRLVLAGTATYPRTVWGSRISDFTNFALGTADDDAWAFTVPVEKGGTILHLASTRVLQVLTYGGEITISGGTDKGLTPTNVTIRQQTAHGTKLVRPFKVSNEIFFIQRAAQRLRSTGYSFSEDSYQSNDLTLLASHITSPGIKECTYAQEPDSIIWAARTDGVLLSCTYDKQQQIQAWARHITDGTVESVASIPYGDIDQVWLLIKRTINGSVTRYLETIDSTLNTDAAYTGTDVTGKATWTGLSHLNGCTVDIVADGVVMPQGSVSGGSITLSRNAYAVEIGLHYDSTVTDMPVELGGAQGTVFGENVSVNEVTVRLYESVGLTVNNEQALPFRAFGTSVLDAPLSPFTGDKKMINTTGWENGGVVTLAQTQPLPCTVLCVVKKVTVNYG